MNERQDRIYKFINQRGNASVKQLKQEMYASEATIRRDLAHLEQEGLLVRTWGGAFSRSAINNDPPSFVRSNANVKAKNAIAKAALVFLQNNMTLFLASGTTVTKFAGYLHKFQNLTVITNGLDIIGALRNHMSAKVIMPGGELYEHYDFVGGLAENVIEQFNADLFFCSCSGITAEGFSSFDMARLNIIKKMKKNSAKTILMVDTSKVGIKCAYKGFGFEDVDYVIMENIPNDASLIKALGKKLIIAKTNV